ncbi:GIY-YIG nuclease family protein [Adhaeribacter rhizoryzae]|uniref:GIY-YIG nuclease family protein n=1 Tax=Adhaeribacter rhizoryzae TaxID=2607907 RepID=A0A5M6DFU4_9BACT|nr:GIY-YIG nuclease family protein [Adhaeribacter rhizoryzae]KAA5546434.1 GIY-YIG nuclease family protein [Adhaeribacter rhizoryzae]
MDFKNYFQEFSQRKENIKLLEKQLEEDYKRFVDSNRAEIRKHIPKNGDIVEYIPDKDKGSYRSEEWKYLKVTDNRIISHDRWHSYIPEIGVIPLDEHYTPLQNYNERITISSFKKIEKPIADKSATIGCIYILNIENTDIHKIGFSVNPLSRISSIRTSNPFDIKIAAIFKCFHANKLERELHNHFQSKRKNREWFVLDNENLKEIKEYIGENLIVELDEDGLEREKPIDDSKL